MSNRVEARNRRTRAAGLIAKGPAADPRALTRRGALELLSASAGGLWLGCFAGAAQESAALPAGCTVRPEQTEGPFFVDDVLGRSDLRLDPARGERVSGVPLELELRVTAPSGDRCEPLSGVRVDVWHCDAAGVYSGVGPGRSGGLFLRGFQRSDASGAVRFSTIYPGSYPGRAVHVHFKLRQDLGAGRAREFTSQLYFDDAINERVASHPAYARAPVANDRDGLFQDGGPQLLVPLERREAGYGGRFELALIG